MKPIRVVIADDYALIRSGLQKELEAQGYEVLGEASDGIKALALVREFKPDVLVLDIEMPRMGGLEVMQILRTESIKKPAILILSAYDKEVYILKALAVGATGYLLKEDALETIVTGVQVVGNRQPWFSPKVMQRITQSAIQKQKSAPCFPSTGLERPLTRKENEVLRLMARGYSNKQIGKALFIEEDTVKKHVSQIYAKLGINKRLTAVLRALVWGLISLQEIEQWVM